MKSSESIISVRLEEHLQMIERLLSMREDISKIADIITKAFRTGRKLLVFGNGGSAADAQHMAGEFVGRFYMERAPLPIVALSVNASIMTAIANDYSFDKIFARQVQALGLPGDVAIGLSTSGFSQNVLDALIIARANGLVTIGFTGQQVSPLADEVDVCLKVPATDTARIQEGHITIIHIVCEIVEKELFGSDEAL